MLRNTLGTLILVLVLAGLMLADEVKGVITKVDTEKGVFTLKSGEKEVSYTVMIDNDTKVTDTKGQKYEEKGKDILKVKGVEKGKAVLVIYEKKDDDKLTLTKISKVVVDIKFP